MSLSAPKPSMEETVTTTKRGALKGEMMVGRYCKCGGGSLRLPLVGVVGGTLGWVGSGAAAAAEMHER